jgi:hypothetical protein
VNEPEFNIGECVTYWPGDHGMNMVVIDVHGATYGLIEPPEGKPLAQHFQATATGADILESDLFHERPPRIFKW